MRNNQLLRRGDNLIRLLDVKGGKAFIIDCKRQTVPKWIDLDTLSEYEPCTDDVLNPLPDINDLDLSSRKYAHEHFTYIAGVLPFVTDKKRRCEAIAQVTEERRISKQTVCNYLWLYLVHQNISALSPKNATIEKPLTDDEKNIRWALNKYFYTRDKNSLNTAYTFMLKEKYCNADGVLLSQYPTFNQFRYYYRKHKKLQNYYISRDGLTDYQRNHRPLLGDGIQEFAPAVGVGMLDATVCDIYLVNDAGGIVGRPILTACVDAYSGICCGYSLSWEGGVYSLRNLMVNVIADKVKICKENGIIIHKEDWNCHMLPGTLVTDMGKEYVSDTFEQIADLGVTVINLPPYRPELKGAVEKFFDVIQELYKPHLKGKGVIEPNFQERGVHDYRKDACLTMADFEKIILRCIIHYNTKRIVENFPFTQQMLADGVKPYASEIWNYGLNQAGANLIPTDYDTLVLVLLPRTTGKFTRRGLIVHKLRYKHDDYTEMYLKGGNVTVAYNPDDVSTVWLISKCSYVSFKLVQSRFNGLEVQVIGQIQTCLKTAKNSLVDDFVQSRVNLMNHIEAIAETTERHSEADIRHIRTNRQQEQVKTHINHIHKKE